MRNRNVRAPSSVQAKNLSANKMYRSKELQNDSMRTKRWWDQKGDGAEEVSGMRLWGKERGGKEVVDVEVE